MPSEANQSAQFLATKPEREPASTSTRQGQNASPKELPGKIINQKICVPELDDRSYQQICGREKQIHTHREPEEVAPCRRSCPPDTQQSETDKPNRPVCCAASYEDKMILPRMKVYVFVDERDVDTGEQSASITYKGCHATVPDNLVADV
jgi:hypothetical protein